MFYYSFLAVFGAQRAPVLLLSIIILLKRNSGPTLRTRMWLLIGTILNIANDLPLNVWASFLPSTIASFVRFVFFGFR